MSAVRRRSGTTSSAAPTRPTWRSGRSWRQRPDGPVLELGCGTGRVALHLARRGHDDDRPRPRPGADRGAAPSGPPGLPLRARRRRRPRASTLDAEIALALAPMQLLQLLADGAEPARAACAASPRTCAPAAASPLAIVEELPGAADGAAAAARRARGRRLGLLQPAARGAVDIGEEIVIQPAAPDGLPGRRAGRGGERDPHPHLSPPPSSRTRPPRPGCVPLPRRADPAHRPPRRLDRRRAREGEPGWSCACSASTRSR